MKCKLCLNKMLPAPHPKHYGQLYGDNFENVDEMDKFLETIPYVQKVQY